MQINELIKKIKLFLKALIPIFTIVFPIALNIFMIMAQIYLPWEGKLTILLTSIAPVINPIVKLTVITSYRKWILQIFEPSHFQHSLFQSTGHHQGSNILTL